jgi:MFS family permease
MLCPMSPRLATALIFVVNGAAIGTWIALIPWISRELDASRTEIGLVLLCSAAGALVSMTLAGQLLTRVSSRRLVAVSALVFPLLAPLPALAPSIGVLAVVMTAFGAANGLLDVSMNAHGVAVERALGRPIMSSLHAGWSIGGLLGAAGVALAAGLGVDAPTEAVLSAGLMLVLALVTIPRLGTGSIRTQGGSSIALPSRAVLPLGLLAVIVAAVEGGISDWAGLYLERDLGADPGLAAASYAVFALGMAVGRLSGDALNRRFGAAPLLSGGLVVTAVSLGAVLVLAHPAAAIVGITLAGIGVANAIPLVFSAGGRIPPSGPSLAAVFTMCYTAFLAGPPVIGAVADRIGLPTTLGLLVVAAVAAAIAAPRAPGIEAPTRLPEPRPVPAP